MTFAFATFAIANGGFVNGRALDLGVTRARDTTKPRYIACLLIFFGRRFCELIQRGFSLPLSLWAGRQTRNKMATKYPIWIRTAQSAV